MAKHIKYEMLGHTADIKIKSYGKTLNEVFENAVLGVSHFLSRGKKIKSVGSKKIIIRGKDLEAILYGFLDELIYMLDADNFVVSKAKLKVKDGVLTGKVYGDSAKKYSGLDHIKAATYSEMYVIKKKSGFEAQFVLDV